MIEGLVFMVVGMVTVFAFLILLVVAMQLSAVFFKKFGHLFPEELEADGSRIEPAAAIAAAIAAIRAKRG